MSKQVTSPEKTATKQQTKPQPTVDSLAGTAEFAGESLLFDSKDQPGTQLDDPRFSTIQRQIIAGKIARSQGNGHLQQAIVFLKMNRPDVHHQSSSTELSSENDFNSVRVNNEDDLQVVQNITPNTGKGKLDIPKVIQAQPFSGAITDGLRSHATMIIQRQGPDHDELIPIDIRVPDEVPRPIFRQKVIEIAEIQIFGRIAGHNWTGGKELYTAEDAKNPIRVLIHASILRKGRRQDGSSSGIKTDEAGNIAGAKERAKTFGSLPNQEKSELTKEIDRRYWATSGLPSGQQIKDPKAEKGNVALWNMLRDEVLAQRAYIQNLPEKVKLLIKPRENGKPILPEDYQKVIQIAQKIEQLDEREIAEYKSRVTAETTDWGAFEKAIDQYVSERRKREATAEEQRIIETRLFGLDHLYQRYLDYRSMLTTNATLSGLGNPQAAGAALGAQPAINKIRADLDADLIKAGFPGGIADFEKFIRDYEKTFERETLAIANVMLDQYAHLLWTQEEVYQKRANADALYDAVNQTKAHAEYEEAERIRSEHASIPYTPDEMTEQAYWSGQRQQAIARGEQDVRSVANAHPLVGNDDFDRERLARAPKDEVQSIMLDYIAARKKDIADTRKNLADNPTMIYGLDRLFNASLQSQNIQRGTIYEKIISNRKDDVHWTEAIPQLVLAVIAVAAGLLTGGSGAVAVLAAGTALGIGAYQAIDEFRRYEMKSAAHGAQLTSEDPTMSWVIIAVIGAGIDVAVFASVLPRLRPALQAFNAGAEAGDVVALEQKLAKLTDVEESIRTNIIRAAEAEAEARLAWKAVFRPTAALRMVIVPGAEEFGRFVYAVYLSFKKGIRDFQVFVKTNEAIALIGDVSKLTAEELAMLKPGYLKAIEEMETVAAHGKALGMTDNEVRAFMNLRGNTKGMTVEQIAKEMDTWKATKGSGVPFGFESAEYFEKFQATASAELKRLLKKADPNAEAFLQGSSVTGVSYKRHLPFDAESDLDIAVSSRYLFKQAEKLGFEIKSNPSHIGPLDPDQIAKLGLGKFQERLSTLVTGEAKAAGATGATKSREINIMLFNNPKAVTAPIGQSNEAVRASIPLKGKK